MGRRLGIYGNNGDLIKKVELKTSLAESIVTNDNADGWRPLLVDAVLETQQDAEAYEGDLVELGDRQYQITKRLSGRKFSIRLLPSQFK